MQLGTAEDRRAPEEKLTTAGNRIEDKGNRSDSKLHWVPFISGGNHREPNQRKREPPGTAGDKGKTYNRIQKPQGI